MIRVLHVDPEIGWGGGQVQVIGLLRELRDRGLSVRLAAAPAGRLAREAQRLGVDVFPVRIRNHLDLRAGLALRRLARDHDVVHFHTARAHAMAPLVTGVGRVVTRRMDYVPRGGPYSRWLYNRSVDRVIAISGAVRAAMLQAGVDPARIRVVPSGVDPAAWVVAADAAAEFRAAQGLAPTTPVVLQVGVLEARKGHDVTLDAIRRMHRTRPEVCYLFCGEGGARAALEQQVAAEHLPVRFLGFRADVAVCIAAADVVLLPSLHEGLGVAALEAMAAARPVIASRVGGLAEVVVDGVTGHLVAPGDADGLAQAIAARLDDRAGSLQMGRAGAARVADRFSIAAMAAGTLACYEELA